MSQTFKWFLLTSLLFLSPSSIASAHDEESLGLSDEMLISGNVANAPEPASVSISFESDMSERESQVKSIGFLERIFTSTANAFRAAYENLFALTIGLSGKSPDQKVSSLNTGILTLASDADVALDAKRVAALEAKLVARKKAVQTLITQNPEKVEELSLAKVRNSLPEQLRSYVEEQVTLPGDLVLSHADDLELVRATTKYGWRSAKDVGNGNLGMYAVVFPWKTKSPATAPDSTLTALRIDNVLVPLSSEKDKFLYVPPTTSPATAPLQAVPVTPTEKDLDDAIQAKMTGAVAGDSNVSVLPYARLSVAAAAESGSGKGGGPTNPVPNNPPAQATQMLKLAIILLNFPDAPSTPITPEKVERQVFSSASSVNAFYQEASFGKVGFEGRVYGWYTAPQARGKNCEPYKDVTAWMQMANDQAAVDGFSPSSYDKVVYAFPKNDACAWGGLAYVYPSANYTGAPVTTNGGLGKWWWPEVVVHELGHTFGAPHAFSTLCTLGDNGKEVCKKGGDPYDPMSNWGLPHFNAYNKERFGWYDAGKVVAVAPPAPSMSGKYAASSASLASQYPAYYQFVLGPYEYETNDVQSIRVPFGVDESGEPRYLYMERREKYGFDDFPTNADVFKGLSLRIGPNATIYSDGFRLIDADRKSDGFTLREKGRFTSSANGVIVENQGEGSVGVWLDTPGCTRRNPAVRVTSTATTSDPSVFLVSAQLTNKDGAQCATGLFRLKTVALSATNPPMEQPGPVVDNISLAPAASSTVSFKVKSPVASTTAPWSIRLYGQNMQIPPFVGSTTARVKR